jgi:WD40 repeat protein
MDLALITNGAVQDALHAIRYGQTAAGSLLVGLSAITVRLREEGIADSARTREWLLGRLLDEIVADGLARLRPEDRAASPEAANPAAELAQLHADFAVGSPTLEAWSVLRCRYLVASPLQMQEMVEASGVGLRTLRRRLNQGHGLVAAELRELELAAERAQDGPASEPPEPAGQAATTRRVLDVERLPVECPYRGLREFREADAAFFFGREAFTELLAEAVRAGPLTWVVGPSGSGKSSVVFAGLVPKLRDAPANGSSGLTTLELRPGRRPFHALAGALVPLVLDHRATEIDRLQEIGKLAEYLSAGSLSPRDVLARAADKDPRCGRTLIVADQFEELYTLCRDEDQQRRFQDLLFETALDDADDLAVKLAVTLRADFMGQALAYRPFADAIQGHDVKLGPMDRAELTRAIRLPAEAQGRVFEAGLVERIADDVADRPGALPLLEFALTRLWEKQEDGWLTHAAYDAVGRVSGAVTEHADAVYQGLPDEARAGARRVFVQLVQPGEGTEDTRRQATRDEVGEDWGLVRRLADARLVVTGQDEAGNETAEVVHEALIGSWARLRDWMNLDRQFRTWQERLRGALRQWQESGEADGALLRGLPLSEAERWLEERGESLAPAERSFVEDSLAARRARQAAEAERAGRERSMGRRVRRLLTVLLAGAVVAAVGGFGLAAAAIAARRESDANALMSRKVALVARSQEMLAEGQGDLALALALDAVEDGAATPAMELALSEAAYAPGTRHVIPVNADLLEVAMHPSGRWAMSVDLNNLRLWDLETGKEVRSFDGHSEFVNSIAFSRDGTLAVSASDDAIGETPDRSVIVWDVATGEPVQMFGGHTAWVMAAAISPDNRQVLSTSRDGTTRLWDIATGLELDSYPYGGTLRTIAFLPDGRSAITQSGDGELVHWDLETANELRRFALEESAGFTSPVINDFAVDPGGRRLAAIYANPGSFVQLWDLDSGSPLRQIAPATGNADPAKSVVFSEDGQSLFIAGPADDMSTWDAETGTEIGHYRGHSGDVWDVAVSPDGLTAATTCWEDGTLRVWNLASSAQQWTVTTPGGGGLSVALSPDGKQAAFSGYDGSVWLLEAATGRAIRRLAYHGDGLFTMAFSPDGQRIAGGGASAGVGEWKATGETLWWRHQGSHVRELEYSDTGDRILTSSFDGTVRLWQATSGKELSRVPIRTVMADFRTGAGALSLSGRSQEDLVAAFGPDPDTVLWGRWADSGELTADWRLALSSVSTGEVLHSFKGHTAAAVEVHVLPDRRSMVSGSIDGTVRWWSLTSGEELDRLELGGAVGALSLDAGGKLMAISTNQGDIFVWDGGDRAVTRHYVGHGDDVNDIAMSADGQRIVSTGPDGTVRAWPVHATLSELQDWIASRRYVRTLTCEERLAYATMRTCDEGLGIPVAAAQPVLGQANAQALEVAELPITPVHHEPMPAVPPVVTRAPVLGQPGRDASSPAQLLSLEVPFPLDAYFRGNVSALGVRPDGGEALFGLNEVVRAFDLETGAERWSYASDANVVVPTLAYTPDGNRAVGGNVPGAEIILWDDSGEVENSVPAGGQALSVAPHPDGRRVAFGTTAALGLWTFGQPEAPDRTAEGYGGITALAFSPDGRLLLSGSGDGHVRLWSVGADGPPQLVRVLGGDATVHTDFVRTVAFHPDGTTAVSGDVDALVWWDSRTGEELHRSTDFPGVFAASFSPDGRYLLTSTADAIIRVWDAASREVVRELKGHTGVRILAAFADGACKVVSAGDDGLLFVWDPGLCRAAVPK